LVRGSGAPKVIQSRIFEINSSLSFFFGGICKSGSVWLTARSKRLFSGSPGTIAGPCSPPLAQPLRESSTNPPLTFSA
jgi:hypothetical protein